MQHSHDTLEDDKKACFFLSNRDYAPLDLDVLHQLHDFHGESDERRVRHPCGKGKITTTKAIVI